MSTPGDGKKRLPPSVAPRRRSSKVGAGGGLRDSGSSDGGESSGSNTPAAAALLVAAASAPGMAVVVTDADRLQVMMDVSSGTYTIVEAERILALMEGGASQERAATVSISKKKKEDYYQSFCFPSLPVRTIAEQKQRQCLSLPVCLGRRPGSFVSSLLFEC